MMNQDCSTSFDPDLHGTVCLVTGASRTLGAAIAARLARSGGRVVVNYHRSQAAAQTLCTSLAAEGALVLALQADITQPAAVEQLVTETEAAFGPVDLLVNNVGPYVDTPFLELTLDDFDHVMAGNVRATFFLSQLVGRRMRERERGQIINIAATDYLHRSHSVYGLAKAGVIYLTEAMALELAPHVRVNAIAPDLIADNEEMSTDFAARSAAGTPLGRLVTRGEIADAVCLLAGQALPFLTGQTLVLDGGRSIPRIALGSADIL